MKIKEFFEKHPIRIFMVIFILMVIGLFFIPVEEPTVIELGSITKLINDENLGWAMHNFTIEIDNSSVYSLLMDCEVTSIKGCLYEGMTLVKYKYSDDSDWTLSAYDKNIS